MRKKRKNRVKGFLALCTLVGGVFCAGSFEKANAMTLQQPSESFFEKIQEKNDSWYVLGRKMTPEEEEEQLDIIKYYDSILNELPVEDETIVFPEDIRGNTSDLSFTSLDAVTDVPREYSSRALGYTPPVRTQLYGDCWAHATTACLEIGMVKNGLMKAEDCNLSESHLIYYYHRPAEDSLGGTKNEYTLTNGISVVSMFDDGGYVGKTYGTLMAGMGPVLENDFYTRHELVAEHNYPSEHGVMAEPEKAYGNKAAIVTEHFAVSMAKPMEVKKAIMEYGAVGISYNINSDAYSADYASQYTDVVMAQNHAVTIVGWNDDFPRKNFKKQPVSNGAWLVRNTWGSDHGDGGYFWLSYEDKTMKNVAQVFKVVSKEKYDNHYHYDKASVDMDYVDGGVEGSIIEGVNLFTMQKEKELLKAVSFHMQWPELDYSIQIYKNPEDKSKPHTGEPLLEKPIEGERRLVGHYTIDLSQPIEVKKGDVIAVSVTFSSEKETMTPALSKPENDISEAGQSMYRVKINETWGEWIDCETSGNLTVRLFTADYIQEEAESHDHIWDKEWSYNDDYHWHECLQSGSCLATEEIQRNFGKHQGGMATCIGRALCDVCEKPYGDTNPQRHGGSRIRRNYQAATTYMQGYTGDICCSACEYVFEAGSVIPILSEEQEADAAKQIQNLTYTFKTIEESNVSTTARDQPKLLIFYDAKDYESLNTLHYFTEDKLAGVDVLAIEISNASKEKVKEIKNSLGPGRENIVFCYDETENASKARLAYEEVYNDITYSALPVICYIDGDDKIRYMTSKEQTYAEIKSNLVIYCNVKTSDLNLNNPSKEVFTSFKGEEMPLTATGKPKVLIFYSRGKMTINTLKSISGEVLPGVDVYAFDLWYAGKDEAESFAAQNINPDSEIKICYDERTMEEMYLYKNTVNNTDDVLYPIICYIDAENKLQHFTMRECTVQDVKNILAIACGYVPGGVKEEDPEPEDSEPEQELILQLPDKRIYLEGETIDLSGGRIALGQEEPVQLEESMLEGLKSLEEGKNTVKVTYKGKTTEFNLFLLQVPTGLTVKEGERLGNISFMEVSYGLWCWETPEQIVEEGVHSYEAAFTVLEGESSLVRENIEVYIRAEVVEIPTEPKDERCYVTFDYQGKGKQTEEILGVIKGQKLDKPENPTEEGWIFDGWFKDDNFGAEWDFENDIVTEEVTLYAKWTIKSDDTGNDSDNDKGSDVGDDGSSSDNNGGSDIGDGGSSSDNDKGSDVGDGGSSSDNNGGSDIGDTGSSSDNDGGSDVGDGGSSSDNDGGSDVGDSDSTSDNDGSNSDNDADQEQDGDIPGMITLGDITITEPSDVIFNGKAHKPVVQVYDRGILLKKNKDYKITYKNNKNANTGGMTATEEFNQQLPSIIIEGKGNYKGSIKINFNIFPASLEENGIPADKVKLSLTEQFVINDKKSLQPFKSIRVGRKLKENVDFIVILTAVEAKDINGNTLEGQMKDHIIPAGTTGRFKMTLEGVGNYRGKIEKEIVVGEKDALMKYAKINLSKEFKKIEIDTFQKKHQGILPKEAYTVTLGGKELTEGIDFTISCHNIYGQGKAIFTVTGIGELLGSKSTSFTLINKIFREKSIYVEGLEDKVYTGKEIVPDDLKIRYEAKELVNGKDYTLTYNKNINKGTASITIEAVNGSGYEGKIKKTFQILPAEIQTVSMSSLEDLVVEYEKGGARPVPERLTNVFGVTLVNKKDYTITYKNNKQVSNSGAEMILKGKGNYTGTLTIPFVVKKTSLSSEQISLSIKSIPYNYKKGDSYEYKPVIRIMNGKETLKAGRDYVITYENNTQAAYKEYCVNQNPAAPKPVAVIQALEGSNYEGQLILELPVYREKLTDANLEVVLKEAVYEGEKHMPEAEVYYKRSDGEKIKLNREEYQLTYGNNLSAGKNKGSIKITGIGSSYGGSVTLKFDIISRDFGEHYGKNEKISSYSNQ